MGFPEEYSGSVSELVERIHSGETAEECTELNFNGYGIGDSGVSQLCTVLNRFTALQKLWLNRNRISSAGVSLLCDILPQCTQLTDLSLDENSIDDIGAKRIAETLKRTKLQYLYIGGNDIGRNGICALFLSAANSQTLTRLSIEGNSGLEDSVADIVDILPHCNTLQVLVVGDGEYSVSGEFRQRILGALQNCTAEVGVFFTYGGRDSAKGQKRFDDDTPAPDRSQLHSIAQRIGFSVDSDDSAHRDPLFDHILKSPVFQTAFLAAMQHGGLHVCRRRVALVGDSRVGKTWTARSLREESNVHPRNDAEDNAARTAAAESTALCTSETDSTALYEAAMVIAEAEGSIDHAKVSTPTPTPDASVPRGTKRRRRDDSPQAAQPGTDGTVYKCHDNIHSFPFPLALVHELGPDRKNTVCYLTLWDFGGQRMYHSWYQFFFAPGMIPCVVFDMSAIVGEGKDAKSREVTDVVQRIVEYGQQSVHFGGSDCRVLLVGTQVDTIAKTPDEREKVNDAVQNILFNAFPEHLRGNLYLFLCSDRSESESTQSSRNSIVCDVDNDRTGRSGMDPGVMMLKTALIRECLRDRSVSASAPVDDAQKVQSFLHRNMLPKHWYEFELDLRKDPAWGSKDFSTIGEVRELARKCIRDQPSDLDPDLDFVGMIVSMAAAGSVVLTKEVCWADKDAFAGEYEALMKSVVILRPQWLIEVGRRLLPRPHEKKDAYSLRLCAELAGYTHAGVDAGQIWSSALVQRDLLYRVLMGNRTGMKEAFADILRLFEERLILCPIRSRSDSPTQPTNQWFLPSVVVFHAEHTTESSSSEIVASTAQDICFTLEFEWLPPGLSSLLVGALLHGMESPPEFAVAAKPSQMVQFSMVLPECVDPVYVDLPNGTGGKTMTVWTRSCHTVVACMEKLMRRVLDAICSACQTLRVSPFLLKHPSQSGLLVSKFTVPLISRKKSLLNPACELRDVCEGKMPGDCDENVTMRLYQTILAEYKEKLYMRTCWFDTPTAQNEPAPASLCTPGQSSGCKHAVTTSQAPESDERLVKQMSELEQDDLALELTEAGKHRMWRAAAILRLNRQVIQAQTNGSDLYDYAYEIVLKCRELRVSKVRDALKQASGSAR